MATKKVDTIENKVAAVKAETAKKAEAVKKAVEPAVKATEKAVEPVKKAVAAPAKKVAKKTAEVSKKVSTEAKKTVAKVAEKKATAKAEIILQFAGKELKTEEIMAAAKKAYAENNKAAIKSITLYVKPEDNAAYYVVNGDVTGKIDL